MNAGANAVALSKAKEQLKRLRKTLRLREDRYMESVAVNHMQRREVDKLQADVANFKAAIVQCVTLAESLCDDLSELGADSPIGKELADMRKILEGIKQSATVVIG